MQLSRLESLPGELLDIVYNNLDEGGKHPISVVLRPYVQQIQYRFIKVDYPHFLLLCRTINDTRHLAALIKELTLMPTKTSGPPGDYQIQHESLVFDFFKSVSLESLGGLEDHPRLQRRIVSAKYAIHCNKSLTALTLNFREDDSDIDPLLQQSRYLSCFTKLANLYVVFGGDDEASDFEPEEEDLFEEEDRLEIERSGRGEHASLVFRTYLTCDTGISVNNTIEFLDIEGGDSVEDLYLFAARFRGLESFNLTMSDGFEVSRILTAINPLSLSRLYIIAPSDQHDELEIDKSAIAPFTNLDILILPPSVYDTDFVTSLSNFPRLTSIVSLAPDCPSAFDTCILLDPRTRPPALKNLDFQPSIWLVSGGRHFSIYFYDPIKQGVALPQWQDGWTLESAREVMELAEQQGIQLVARKSFEIAIVRTEEYWAARGELVASASDEE